MTGFLITVVAFGLALAWSAWTQPPDDDFDDGHERMCRAFEGRR